MTDQARDTWFDRIAILVLAVEWVVFGAMHFSNLADTIAQIPDWIPFKPAVAIVTGLLEVSTGILILFPPVRRWAALSSLLLLAALVPAMYKILFDPAAVAGLGAGARVFRIVLLPNNIFMAICAVHLWRRPDARPARTDRPSTPAAGP